VVVNNDRIGIVPTGGLRCRGVSIFEEIVGRT
jgi:hypothetical protein